MQLSIIIVSYNVKYFLEQCLRSVHSATGNMEAEVWVIDNASSDGSVEYLLPKFPWAYFISNSQNVGFAKANNQVLDRCSGKYILYLNPDTIIPEDCLEKAIAFMELNLQAGALGIRMIDGTGTFLPESKRAFPSPVTSFYKLSGLGKLFPSSKIFTNYSLAHLNEFENHEVDVLAGAFMLVKHDLIKQLNGFDEAFFMYGEDIDLSYRIQKLGYKNYYFSKSTIIHFKGESTRKSSLNYVKIFYIAMSIFVKKHYAGGFARLFVFFIEMAIWVRAILSVLLRFVLKTMLPLTDVITIFCAFTVADLLVISFINSGDIFLNEFRNVFFWGFAFVYLVFATLTGMYRGKYKFSGVVFSTLTAMAAMLTMFPLLYNKILFRKEVIVWGGILSFLFITILHKLLLKYRIVEDKDNLKRQHQTIIAGTKKEYEEVRILFVKAGLQERIMGRLAINSTTENPASTINGLPAAIENAHVKEIIFCQGHLSHSYIIDVIQNLKKNITVRFHASGTQSIVGSDSKNTSGECICAEGRFMLNHPYQQRMKRMVDVSFAVILLITFPIHIFLLGYHCLLNAVSVISGKKTWVSYIRHDIGLPLLRKGVLTPVTNRNGNKKEIFEKSIFKVDYWYAKNYDWRNDVKIILKNYSRLTGKV